MHRGETWTLRQGSTLLGTIKIKGPDFPWLLGRWTPTDAFERVRHLFERELSLLSEIDDATTEWQDAYQDIWQAALQLHDPDGTRVAEWLLHVDGDSAWFRWSDERFSNTTDTTS